MIALGVATCLVDWHPAGLAYGRSGSRRGGGGTALSTLQAAHLVLERRVRELEVQGKMDAATIAELKGKTDVALAVQPFMKWAELHETRAAERHIGMMKAQEQTTTILTMIGERLGTDA